MMLEKYLNILVAILYSPIYFILIFVDMITGKKPK